MADVKTKVEKADETLEEVLGKLDHVMQDLSQAQVSLEDSFELYHKGMKLVSECNDKIDAVEKKMKILEENGAIHEFEE